MKPISASIVRALPVGAYIKCADNTGATLLQIIAVKGYKGVARRKPAAGIADVVVCTVKDGDEKMRHQIVTCAIVRQRKEYRRANGMRIKFEDNAAVVINELGERKGTRIKGPIAKEVVERFSAIGKIASIIV